MAINPMDVYLNRLGDGKSISTEEDFDISNVINTYGGVIEYADLYEDVFKLDSIIYKSNEGFRMVVDQNVSNQIKESGTGNWNLFVLDLFYFVLAAEGDKQNYATEQIIHPNPKYAEAALVYKDIVNNGKDSAEAKRIASVLKSPCPTIVRDQYVKKLEFIRGQK